MPQPCLVEPLIEVLLERLTSNVPVLDFLSKVGLCSKFTALKDDLRTIQTLLLDAESQRSMNRDVKDWLDNLENFGTRLELIFMELDTDILSNKKSPRKLSLSLKGIKFRLSMRSKMKDITSRLKQVLNELDRLCKLKDGLGLRKTDLAAVAVAQQRRITRPVETERVVYGRKQDKLELLSKSDGDVPKVIIIAGMGGIGKSTLARMVYNDESIHSSFDTKAWICLSNSWDVITIWQAIIHNITAMPCDLDNPETLVAKLRREIAGKKFLLVLDDFSDRHARFWEVLQSPFMDPVIRSKIIVTTRYEKVSEAFEPPYWWLHKLQMLSDDDCWSLFINHAYDDRYENIHPDFHPDAASIRKVVLQRSRGLPLTSAVLGDLLRTTHMNKWLEILRTGN